jgi:hypothetical protein
VARRLCRQHSKHSLRLNSRKGLRESHALQKLRRSDNSIPTIGRRIRAKAVSLEKGHRLADCNPNHNSAKSGERS